MKRIPIIMLVFALLLALCACGTTASKLEAPSGAASSVPKEESKTPEPVKDEPKAEIVYQRLEVYTNALNSVCATYVAEIKNTGTCTIGFTSDASIDIENASGSLVTTKQYISIHPDVIAPGESAYITTQVYNDMLDGKVEAAELAQAIFHFAYAKNADYTPMPISVSDISISEKYSSISVTARLENTGSETITSPWVVIPVRDASGTLVSALFTIGDDLAAGAQRGIEQTDVSGLSVNDCTGFTATVIPFETVFVFASAADTVYVDGSPVKGEA